MSETDADETDRLIADSSLGTAGAKHLRKRADRNLVAATADRARKVPQPTTVRVRDPDNNFTDAMQDQVSDPPNVEVSWRGHAELSDPTKAGDVVVVVPILLVLDVSPSMQGDLVRARGALDEFTRKLRGNPALSSSTWFGIVTFADNARSDLPLVRIADPAVQLPQLTPRGSGTNFHAGLTEALARLRTDLPRLATTAEGGRRQIFRPTIYFVSDGENTTGPDWREPLNVLRSRVWRPNVMAFGYRDSAHDTIREIASEGMAYSAVDGQDPDTVFEQIIKMILRSVITTTTTCQQLAANPTAPITLPILDPQNDDTTAGLALI